MLDPEDLVGKAVVAIAQATKLGYVTDLLFGVDPFAVRSLRLRGDEGDFLLPFEAIARIGPDAITVTDQNTATTTPGTPAETVLTRAEVHALKVLDESGTLFGTVKSVEVDAEAGRVQRVTATRGGVLGVRADVRTFAADAIRHVGSEILTVAETGGAESGTE